MTLAECYAQMDGDLNAALHVLESDTRLARYLVRFLDEPTARMLFLAIEDERWKDALRAAHTMKGLCRGLGLVPLHDACSDLADMLREGGSLTDARAGERVRAEYDRVVQAVRALGEEA